MNGTQTLNRAFEIIFALAEADGYLTVSDIARKVSIPESSTYRFLQTMEQNGIVERRGNSRIGLGMRILDLARNLSKQVHRELIPLALPFMEELTRETNETALLFVRSGTNAVCIQNMKSRALIQYSTDNGRILPLHLGASGKAILAYEGEKVLQAVLDKIPTESDHKLLLEDLIHIRRQGYAVSQGEADPDVYAIASPIFHSPDSVTASISIAGPTYRFDENHRQHSIGVVVRAAEQISGRLGNFNEL